MNSIKLIFSMFASILLLNSCFKVMTNSNISPEIGLALSIAQEAGIIVDPTGNPFDNYVVIKSTQLANPVDRANSYDIGAYAKFTLNGVNADVGTININNRSITADANNLYEYIYKGSTLAEGKALFESSLLIDIPGIDNPQQTTTPLGFTYMVVPKEIFPSNISLPGTRINRSVDYSLSWNPDPNNQYQKVKIQVSYYKAMSQYNNGGMPNSITSLNYIVSDNGNFVIPQADLSRFPVNAYLGISIARASMVTNTNNVVYVSIVEAHTIPILVVDNSSFCLATQSISGDNNFCTTSNNYSIPNLPAGATVAWSAAPAGLVTVNSPNSPETKITSTTTNGVISLTAVVSNACGGQISITKPNIIVGTPQASNIIISNSTSYTNMGTPVSFVAGYSPDNRCQIQSTEWQVSMDASVFTGNVPCEPENGTSKYIIFQSPGTAYVQARIQNGCGWSDWSAGVPITVSSGFYFTISPNPTSTEVTVNQKDETTAGITEIKIFDSNGNLKKQSKYTRSTRQAKLNIFGLNSGIYFIEISSSQYKERQQLVIQK